MKNVIYFDTSLLHCPNSDSEDAFKQFVERILSWGNLRKETIFDTFISETACMGINYLTIDVLKNLLARFNIDYLQAKDIQKTIDSFYKVSSLEEKLGILDIAWDKINIEPNDFVNSLNDNDKKCFYFLSILVSLHKQFNKNALTQTIVATGNNITNDASVEANVVIEKNETSIIPGEMILSLQTSGTYCLVSKKASFLNTINPTDLWAYDSDENELRKGVEIFIFQNTMFTGDFESYCRKITYSFGSHFIESCRKENIFSSHQMIRKVIRSCAEIVTQTKTNNTHWLRQDNSGAAPQRKRKKDGAGAWRQDIDYEYHLHYWQTPSGPELANVVTHNNFDISE